MAGAARLLEKLAATLLCAALDGHELEISWPRGIVCYLL